MLTLSYGYFKPQTGDRGSVWFPRLEDNFQRLNDHNHDGSNSSLLTPAAISKALFKTVILSAAWSSLGGGNYRQTITVPSGVTELNNYVVQFYVTATGVRVFPSFERQSATSYFVFTNDNSLGYTAIYV